MVKVQTDVTKIVNKYIKALSREIVVDKVILISPLAGGEASEWSDIEFVVISKDFVDMLQTDRLDLLATQIVGINNWLVPHGGYTPDEYEHPEKTLRLGWVKSTGRVIYESN